ncbi:MAG TPA: HEAT repeat domain-containing protein [Gemmatimonadaceae bacterium]|nr:HEAT repeat domain-containing protein [Gemmatimonadaceae bacterium]
MTPRDHTRARRSTACLALPLALALGGTLLPTAWLASQPAPSSASLRAPAAPEPAASRALDRAVAQIGAWMPEQSQDPADSILRDAQTALRRNDLRRAAALFQSLRESHPRSRAAQNAGYWEAFARHRLGGKENLEQGQRALRWQASTYPDAATRADADALSARLMRDAALVGDADAAQQLVERSRSVGAQCPREDEDERLMVLDALLSVDAERALPTLKNVLARRDECSAALRRKAVFLVSRKRSAETEDILLATLRSDPDAEVRAQAVFWLGQVNSEKSTTALIELLRTSRDEAVLEKVAFALSQQRNERARSALRDLVRRNDVPLGVRGNAIFWLGQRAGDAADAVPFLIELYPTLTERALQERVLASIAQRKSPEAQAFLTRVALDSQAPLQLRRNAIFHASQAGLSTAQLRDIFRTSTDRRIREQVVFAIANQKNTEAVDALFDIVKSDADRETRRVAIFWLGQSKDPRVPSFLEQILNK